MRALTVLIVQTRVIALLCVFTLMIFSFAVHAQSKTILGTSSLARDCYLASIQAATTDFSSREDLETCNEAIFQGGLGRRDKVATFVNRGIIKVASQDFVGGVRDYETALDIDPECAEAYLNRGNLWFIARKFDEAIDDYAKAMEFGVRQEQVALLNTGMAYENLSQFETAKNYYESALEKFPEWPSALEKLERVSKKLENPAPVEE